MEIAASHVSARVLQVCFQFLLVSSYKAWLFVYALVILCESYTDMHQVLYARREGQGF